MTNKWQEASQNLMKVCSFSRFRLLITPCTPSVKVEGYSRNQWGQSKLINIPKYYMTKIMASQSVNQYQHGGDHKL